MVVSNLFERDGLYNDIGLLKERWNQEGSEPTSTTGSFSSGSPGTFTIYTVTAGKVFYVKNITFYDNNANTHTIADDGTAKIYLSSSAANYQYDMTFPSPIKFETNATISIDGSGGGVKVALVGWEEDA